MDIGIIRNARIKHVLFETNFGKHTIVSGEFVKSIEQGEQIKIQYHNDSVRLKIGERSLGHFDTVYFYPKYDDNIFKITCLSPSLKSRKYYTQLKVFSSNGQLTLVNQIDLERYLIGVLESEVGPNESKDFYKVHAVISRTYALKNKYKFSHEGFHLTDLVNCQVYKGKMYKNKNIIDAVKETKNLVLVDDQMNYITASYFSNSGGQTVNVEDVWLKPLPYLRSIEDPYSRGTYNYKWEKRISKDKWISYLKRKHNYPINDPNAIDDACNFKQPKRTKYFINWKYHILLTEIRTDWKLKSTFFSVYDDGEYIILKGKGFGHGVGLSQEGAMQMVKLGYGFLEVLRFYYTDVHLINLQMRDFYLSD
tara:strand:- start:118 stop:1212 length:1095 start_codon:yes stop_codon:yes gene_type:complete